MSKPEVFFILGSPNWVILPIDVGEFENLDKDKIILQYYWKNGKCNAVAVDFDYEGRLIGWDGGRALCLETPYPDEYLPGAEYLCTNERQRYCDSEWFVE